MHPAGLIIRRLLAQPVTGWLVGALACALVWFGMDYRLALAQRDAAQQAVKVVALTGNVATLKQSIATQNTAIERMLQNAQRNNETANQTATRVLHTYTTRPADITHGPEELNQWLQNLLSSPPPSAPPPPARPTL